MSFLKFLGDAAFWQKWGYTAEQAAGMDKTYGWVQTVYQTVLTILVPILAIVAAAGIIWAIVLGVNMARADSTEKREEAKKRLIGLIVGIVILVVLIVFFTTLFPVILKAFIHPEEIGTGGETASTVVRTALSLFGK